MTPEIRAWFRAHLSRRNRLVAELASAPDDASFAFINSQCQTIGAIDTVLRDFPSGEEWSDGAVDRQVPMPEWAKEKA